MVMSNKVFISIGAAFSGFFALLFFQWLLNSWHTDYLYFFILTLSWILAIDIAEYYLKRIISNNHISFSVAWMTPLLALSGIGLTSGKVNCFLLSLFLFFHIGISYYKNKSHYLIMPMVIKNIGGGFILGLLMLVPIMVNNFPWLEMASKGGIAYIDDYRDAAVFNSYAIYNKISHGVHGLLFEPYHGLSAFFFKPLVTNDGRNIFRAFTGISYIFTSSLLIYGILSLIEICGGKYIKKNIFIVLIFFIVNFSCFDYVAKQRSVFISTFILIGVIPLLINIYKKNENLFAAVIGVGLLIPVLMFARAFTGVLVASIYFFTVFHLKSKKIILVIIGSTLISMLIIFSFYGVSNRATGGTALSSLLLFLSPSIWSIDPWILVFYIMLGFGVFRLSPAHVYKRVGNILHLFLYTCISGIILFGLAKGVSDGFYQLLPVFWVSFFVMVCLTNSDYRTILSTRFFGKNINSFLPVIVLIAALGAYMKYTVPNFVNSVHSEIYHFNDVSKFKAAEKKNIVGIESSSVELDKSLPTMLKMMFHFLSSKSLSEINNVIGHNSKLLEVSLPAEMALKAQKATLDLKGWSAIYVSPENDYWRYPFISASSSLYFQATIGIPMLFGVPSGNSDRAYSIQGAHLAGGTLRELDFSNDSELICEEMAKWNIRNLIIFGKTSESLTALICEMGNVSLRHVNFAD